MTRRRRFLAAAGATLLAPSGCLGVRSGPGSLGTPREESDADGREKHLVFARDGERQAVVSIMQRLRPRAPDRRIPFRLHVWHREGLSIDRLHYRLRAPPHGTGVPADVYLKVPDGGPWPPFDLRRDDELWTVVEVDEIGRLGDGSLGLDVVVDPGGRPVEELAVRAEVEFGESGIVSRSYRAEATTRFEVVPSRE